MAGSFRSWNRNSHLIARQTLSLSLLALHVPQPYTELDSVLMVTYHYPGLGYWQ